MKSSGFKSRAGGLKRKSPSSQPLGISRTRLGDIRVKDPAYLRMLHDLKTPPLETGLPIEKSGVMDLHHLRNPQPGARRRDNDAGVVPLDHSVHMSIEMNPGEEKVLHRAFACWAAMRYWCHAHGLTGTNEDASAFQRWVLEQMLEEQNADTPGD